MTRLEILRDTFTKCPECRGNGVYITEILKETCCWCNGYGYVNVFKKILWKLRNISWNMERQILSLIYHIEKRLGVYK